MKYTKYILLSSALFFIFSCENDSKKTKRINWNVHFKNVKYTIGQDVKFDVNIENNTPDSITVLTPEGKKVNLGSNTFSYTWNNPKNRVGIKDFTFSVHTNGKKFNKKKTVNIYAPNPPAIRKYELVATYPHDKTSFTQGLEFDGDNLYEGTGQNGSSKLMQVDLKTGKAIRSVDLDPSKFGEGITLLNDKIYQLTWRNGFGLIYNKEDFKFTGNFAYGKSLEGWGLCNDKQYIYKSDGTSRIYKLDPKNLQELDYIDVMTDRTPVNMLNELEWVDGKIYANVYLENYIIVINPKSGAVEEVIPFTELVKQESSNNENVLNGIAQKDSEKDHLYITGKNWDNLFKVKIVR
jgi:glutaminyl-peptide cyclotransferase